jgi:DNA-binding transcriptional MerR regulator
MELWNQTDAALACGVSDAMWRYYTKAGYVPRPSHRCGRRCYYTRDEIDDMKKLFVDKVAPQLAVGNIDM